MTSPLKITITIQNVEQNGAFITVDPSITQLLEQVQGPECTTAHHYALCAWRAIATMAMLHAAMTGGTTEVGETPPKLH